MLTQSLQVGQMVKVLLPGERPWAEVVSMTDGGFIGRIDNVTLAERSDEERGEIAAETFQGAASLPKLHLYKLNDEVQFEWHPEWEAYIPTGETNWAGQPVGAIC